MSKGWRFTAPADGTYSFSTGPSYKQLKARIAELEQKLKMATKALNFYSKNPSLDEDYPGKKALETLSKIRKMNEPKR